MVTSKARTAIRKELKDIKDEDALVLGHRMLDRALDTFGYSFEKLDSRAIKRVLKHYQLDSMDELLKAFAYGRLLPSIAARKLMPLMAVKAPLSITRTAASHCLAMTSLATSVPPKVW